MTGYFAYNYRSNYNFIEAMDMALQKFRVQIEIADLAVRTEVFSSVVMKILFPLLMAFE